MPEFFDPNRPISWGYTNETTVFGDKLTFEERIGFSKNVLLYTFGSEWLEKQNAAMHKRKIHPIHKLWANLIDFQHSKAQLQNRINAFGDATILGELVAPLSFACLVPGFKESILPRLKNFTQFDGAMFEVLIASKFAADKAHKVQFIPTRPNENPTPDLEIIEHNNKLLIECKKVVYLVDNPSKDKILAELSAMGGNFPLRNACNIALIIIGDPKIDFIATSIATAISAANLGAKGYFFEPKSNMAYVISDTKSGFDHYKFDCTFDLPTQPASCKLSISLLRGVKITSVLNSLRNARAQFNTGEVGVVALQVSLEKDRKKLTLEHMSTLFSMIDLALREEFWAGGKNSRIKAILAVQGPYPRTVSQQDIRYERTYTTHGMIRNPYAGFLLPDPQLDRSNVFRVLNFI